MAIRVFISYSHDSADHLNRIWDLCERLRVDGIDCQIDQHEQSPPQGWARWCRKQIQEAHFVLVSCTETYNLRYEDKAPTGIGLGTSWEGHVITQEMYESPDNNPKFIPILFASDNRQHIPLELRGVTHYLLATEEGYEHLFRRLSGQPLRSPAKVSSSLRSMPTLSRHTAPTQAPIESAAGPDTASVLCGVRTVQIYISQPFRIADLLIYPSDIRARGFGNIVHDNAKLRRALNGRLRLRVGALGIMRPVVTVRDQFDDFWRLGVPDFRRASTQQLWFLPFELSLTEHLNQQYDSQSMLKQILAEFCQVISSTQVSGRLRIYPTGVGVVRIGLTLTFNQHADIRAITKIAQEIEEAFFVDPDGREKPFLDVLTNIIDEVADSLFVQQRIPPAGRRWHPPEMIYYLHDSDSFRPEQSIQLLTELLSQVPENEEDPIELEHRIRKSIASAHWQRDRTLAIAGDGVALIFLEHVQSDVGHRKRNKLIRALTETSEVVSAGAYSEKALLEELQKISTDRSLDDEWPEWRGEKFDFLERLLRSLKMVLQAVACAKLDLQRRGAGILMKFATDIWSYDNPVSPEELNTAMDYAAAWLSRSKLSEENHKDIAQQLGHCIEEIRALSTPFRYRN